MIRRTLVLLLGLLAACGSPEPSAPITPEPPPEAPIPTPEPAREPEPEPARVPDPEPTPTPEPARDPEPEPTPDPDPTPEPTLEPVVVADAPPTDPAATDPEAPPSADTELDERDTLIDGTPFDVTLRGQARLGPGAWRDGAEAAAMDALVDSDDPEDGVTLASVEHRRRTFVLFRAIDARMQPARRHRPARPFRTLWLASVEARADPDDATLTQYRRVAATRLYDGALIDDDSDDWTCTTTAELRARDVDADGEVELTAIAPIYTPGTAVHDYECGAVAFLIGGDDLAEQARFSREYRSWSEDAGGTGLLTRDATWILRDVDGDGHADLHVTERMQYRFDFEGDFDGVGTAPGDHERRQDRQEVDCLYSVPADRWVCPDQPVLGQTLFVEARRLPPRVEAP